MPCFCVSALQTLLTSQLHGKAACPHKVLHETGLEDLSMLAVCCSSQQPTFPPEYHRFAKHSYLCGNLNVKLTWRQLSPVPVRSFDYSFGSGHTSPLPLFGSRICRGIV
uniref:Glutathione S-transferase Mu 5 n=1 Tax=Schistocephalus solidus TaxID=70667 RepID=A0A0X3P4G7_SCHSO